MEKAKELKSFTKEELLELVEKLNKALGERDNAIQALKDAIVKQALK